MLAPGLWVLAPQATVFSSCSRLLTFSFCLIQVIALGQNVSTILGMLTVLVCSSPIVGLLGSGALTQMLSQRHTGVWEDIHGSQAPKMARDSSRPCLAQYNRTSGPFVSLKSASCSNIDASFRQCGFNALHFTLSASPAHGTSFNPSSYRSVVFR